MSIEYGSLRIPGASVRFTTVIVLSNAHEIDADGTKSRTLRSRCSRPGSTGDNSKEQPARAEARGTFGNASSWRGGPASTSATAGTGIDARNAVWFSKAALRNAELPDTRRHEMQRTAATLLLTLGVAPHIDMKTLGHSQISLTLNTNAHAMPDMQQVAVDAFVSSLFGTARVPVASPHG